MYRVWWRVERVRINGVYLDEPHIYSQICRNDKSLENFKRKHNVIKVVKIGG